MFFWGGARMRRLKSMSGSRAVYADAGHYLHVSSCGGAGAAAAGQRETSYLCQYASAADSSLPLCDHHHSPAAGPPAVPGLYRYTACTAPPQPPSSPAVVYAGCDEHLLQPA